MRNLPFLEDILADLRRFAECVEDNNDVNLERSRFDLLVQLGLLERVQRSPARWMMTQAGEDAIAPPAAAPVAAGEPTKYWAFHNEFGELRIEDQWDVAKRLPFDLIPLITVAAPPAAVHGDDTRRIDWLACTWRLGGKLPDVDHGSFREVIDATMRAQGDGEVQ